MMRNKLLLSLCIAILTVSVVLVGSVTYARYREAVAQEMAFTAKTFSENGMFAITSANGWQTTADGVSLTFTLSFEGKATENRPAVLQLTATEGFSETAQVIVTVGDTAYTATPTRVVQGSALHAQMGDGYLFRFTDEHGERTWPTDGKTTMRLQVLGASDTALLRVIVK